MAVIALWMLGFVFTVIDHDSPARVSESISSQL
jgi:hypothetical protein